MGYYLENNSRRSKRKKNDYLVPGLILCAILLAGFYLYRRVEERSITQDELIVVSVALVAAVVAFICCLPFMQRWFHRKEHERLDEEQRKFWREREKRERMQRERQQKEDQERRQREQQRQAETLQRRAEFEEQRRKSQE